MGLTEAERVFGGITEEGFNDLLQAFFNFRPRHLRYGSPGFVPATTVGETQMPAIPFPGVPGGIDWLVELSVPVADFHPQTGGLPPELSLGANQVSLATTVRLCVACEPREGRWRDRRDEEHEDRPDDAPPEPDDERDDWDREREEPSATCFSLDIAAIGHLQRTFGPDGVVVVIDAVEIVDIEPQELEDLLECLMLQILRAILSQVRLPLATLRAGAFSLTLTRGPEIEDDQTKVYGNL